MIPFQDEVSYDESNVYSSQSRIKQKSNALFNVLHFYAVKIWPYINKTLNFFFYHILRIVKGFVKVALQEIGILKE